MPTLFTRATSAFALTVMLVGASVAYDCISDATQKEAKNTASCKEMGTDFKYDKNARRCAISVPR